MHSLYLLAVIMLPVLGGALVPLFSGTRRRIYAWIGLITLTVSAFTWALILLCPEDPVELVHFTDRLVLEFQFDGLGRFFAGIIATLWPLTVLYAYEYMDDDERPGPFFAFFTISYGVTLGVSMAGNIFTLYVFYELLTLSTVPLVMHTRTRDAIRATRTYFSISLSGAAFAFISMMYLVVGGGSGEPEAVRQLFFLFGFFGFGVKAAVFPLHFWLPQASVAPTPVTALLHAVAVVKAGVFAIIRLSWCGYGADVLRGTPAQWIAMGFAIFTILFGAVQAVREPHFKRRMAYSTVSNLSYILFGALMFTEEGLQAGLLHMAFHAEIKILGFFAVGAVMHHTGREYVSQLDGLGRRMPVTFGCFTAAALALIGIPPFSGFVSKWSLLRAAAAEGGALPKIGSIGLLVSALLTAVYMLTVLRRAFFPDSKADLSGLAAVREAGPCMQIPMVILAVSLLATGLLAGQIQTALTGIVSALNRW